MNTLLAASLIALCCGAVQAQTVWRCGPEGRTYSDEPCAGGRVVDVADPRTPEQLQAARAQAARDTAAAQRMAAERAAQEREQARRPLAAAGIGPSTEPALSPVREWPVLLAPSTRKLPQAHRPQRSPKPPSKPRTSPGAERGTLRGLG